MELKRIFDKESPEFVQAMEIRRSLVAKFMGDGLTWAQAMDKANDDPKYVAAIPKPVGIDVKHTGHSAKQNFSTKLVHELLEAGMLTLDKDLVLKTASADLRYKVLRRPGLYCCHCSYRPGDQLEARAHIKSKHFGVVSPDKQNPYGYAQLSHFECVLDTKQHEKFHAKPIGSK
jgi:hypothetical protein